MDQNSFMETVKEVAEIVRVAETPMSQEEILVYFEDMNLDENQKTMVLDYILNHSTDVEEEQTSQEAVEPETEGTQEESVVFRMYLEEIESLKKYSHEEEDALYTKLLAGDEKTISELLDCWLLRVLECAKGYAAPKINIEDLVQEGNVALFVALQTLCGSGACENVVEHLKESVEKGIMEYASSVTQVREQEEAVLAKIRLVDAAIKLLQEENGKTPSVTELSDYTKMSVEELKGIIELLEEQEKE